MQVAAREEATPHALGARVAACRSTTWRAECTRVDLESEELATTHAFIAEWRGDSDDDDDDGSDEQLQAGGRKGSTSWSESDRTNAASTRVTPVLSMLRTALHTTDELVRQSSVGVGCQEDVTDASPVKKPVKLHTRTRRAQEIKRLTAEREELEKRLRVVRDMVKSWPLRAMDLCDVRHNPYAASSPSSTTMAMTVTSQQQRQAELEREALLISQDKNRSLRAELKMQKQASRSLYRLMLRRAAEMVALRKSLRLPLLPCALPRDALDNRAVFARLLAATSAMFKDVDRVAALLRSRIKLSEEGSFRAWSVNERALSGNGAAAPRLPGPQLQLVDCEELPFPRPQVHHAIRAFYKETEIRDFAKEHFNIADNDDDTIIMKLVLSRDTKEAGLIHVRMRQVVRSFNTPENSGFVSLLEVDLLTLDGQPLPTGLTITEQKWTILPRHNSTAADTLDKGYETTQNQTFAIISQEVSGVHFQAPPPLLTLAADLKGGGDKLPADAEEWDTSYSSTNRRIQNHLMSLRAPPQVC